MIALSIDIRRGLPKHFWQRPLCMRLSWSD